MHLPHPHANAAVDYVDENKNVVATDKFYDPGLDENSWYAKEQKQRGIWRGPHLAYGCGRAIAVACLLALTACSTAQVTATCQRVSDSVLLDVALNAPAEISVPARLLRAGAYICGTPEYAAARERVIIWLRSRGAGI